MEYADGFDTYTDVADRWPTVGGFGSCTISKTAGRDGRGALVSNKAYAIWSGASEACRTIGFAFKGDIGTGAPIITLSDGGTAVAYLTWDVAGTFSVERGSDNTILGTSTVALPGNTWGYVEFLFTASTSLAPGACVVRLNNGVVLTLTSGAATSVTGHLTFNRVGIGSNSGALNSYTATVDDLVFLDASESFWGDVTVEGHTPDGPGLYSQFTPTGASQNYECVDEVPNDGDTTYVAGAFLHQRDSYAFPTQLQGVLSVKAVQVAITAKQVGSSPIGLEPSFRQSGEDHDGAAITLGTSYATTLVQYEVNPLTGVAWTPSDVAAIEAGATVTT